MVYETEWVPFHNRTSDIQDKVAEIYELYADRGQYREPIDLYEAQKWGSLQQAYLYRGLLESLRRETILSASEIIRLSPIPATAASPSLQEDEAEEPIVVSAPNNAQVGQPLKWFLATPPNSRIRDEADDQYRIRLLNLYISHVNETGETYYPRLEQMLRAYAEFYGF